MPEIVLSALHMLFFISSQYVQSFIVNKWLILGLSVCPKAHTGHKLASEALPPLTALFSTTHF